MTKILEGEAALDYNRRILEVLEQKEIIEKLLYDEGLLTIGTLIALQCDWLQHAGIEDPTKFCLPVVSTGFPEEGTLVADAQQGYRLNLEIESRHQQVAKQIIADFAQLDNSSLSTLAKERTALASADERPVLPWRPTPETRERVMTKTLRHFTNSTPTSTPIIEPKRQNLRDIFRKKPGPTELSQIPSRPNFPSLFPVSQTDNMLILNSSTRGYKFVPIDPDAAGFSGSLILEFDLEDRFQGSKGSKRLVSIYPDESGREAPPQRNH